MNLRNAKWRIYKEDGLWRAKRMTETAAGVLWEGMAFMSFEDAVRITTRACRS